jgi:hypothetical protein
MLSVHLLLPGPRRQSLGGSQGFLSLFGVTIDVHETSGQGPLACTSICPASTKEMGRTLGKTNYAIAVPKVGTE